MEQGSSSRHKALDKIGTVVDADSHIIGEPLEEIVPLIDDRYAGAREIIQRSENVHTEIFSTMRAGPIHPFESEEDGIYAQNTAESVLQEKREQMAEFGFDVSILNPTLFSAITSINNPRYAVALANAYNEWIISQILDRESSLRSTILIAPQKPHLAAEEIDDRADEDGMVGVQLSATGLVPPPGHEWYDPIYEAAEDNDLPVAMHSNGAMTHRIFPVQYRWNEGWAEDHALLHPFQLMWNLTTMVFRGVPERFPNLEFVLSEAGLGWIPYTMWRLDDHYLEHSHEMPLLDRLPSDYIRDQFYFTTQPIGHMARDPSRLATVIEMIGSDCVLFSSDLPHHDFDTPEEFLTRVRSLDDETLADVMGGSAARVYGL